MLIAIAAVVAGDEQQERAIVLRVLTACFVGLVLCGIGTSAAEAQFGQKVAVEDGGPRLGDEQVERYRIGVVVNAGKGLCKGIKATVPVPMDWPEQDVEIVEEDLSAGVKRVSYRDIGGSVQQMVVEIPILPAGHEARAVMTYEIRRRQLLAPEETAGLKIPDRLDRQMMTYLGPSPAIEVRNRRIQTLAREIVQDKDTAWEQVEAMYDWVRDNIRYEDMPLKGALAALKDGNGDCEELSSLFIALCRANKIPARTVWVPGHCYAEFYLEDADGQGHWFPCQLAGTRAFGAMPEYRPILQKGDNFQDPDRSRDTMRYVSEYLTGAGGQPSVNFVREPLK